MAHICCGNDREGNIREDQHSHHPRKRNYEPRKTRSDSAHDGPDTPMTDKYFEGLVTLALNEESTSMAEKSGGDESCLCKTEQGIAKRKATQTVGLCV